MSRFYESRAAVSVLRSLNIFGAGALSATFLIEGIWQAGLCFAISGVLWTLISLAKELEKS